MEAKYKTFTNHIAKSIPIEDLISPNPHDYEYTLEISNSIKEQGLKYPLICWSINHITHNCGGYNHIENCSIFDEETRGLKYKLLRTKVQFPKYWDREGNLTKTLYIVETGNNRLAAALLLGHTEIDCMVYDIFNEDGYEEMMLGIKTCQEDLCNG